MLHATFLHKYITYTISDQLAVKDANAMRLKPLTLADLLHDLNINKHLIRMPAHHFVFLFAKTKNRICTYILKGQWKS